MERKRKLPARAAARVDHIAKKRTVTPPEHRSPTPSPVPVEEPPPPLPKSVQAGKPLPTVEDAQPEDLPVKEYQSIQESGVLAESLHRSRQKWITEGIFEKYWTKPYKKKGVMIEEPNNPAKDTMAKIGQVTITIEPHVFEATMWAIKDPKPPVAPAPTTAAAFRPILQYGPPNGSMPPPPSPSLTTTSPAPVVAPAPPGTTDQKPTPLAPPPALPSPVLQQPQPRPQSRPQSSATNEPPKVAASPRGMEPVLAPNTPQASRPPSVPAALPPGTPTNAVPAIAPAPPGSVSRPTSTTPTPAGVAPKPAVAPKAPGTDPIIMTLAERASEDPQLRDLMKRVAAGEAKPEELSNFQKIIDRITTEYKQKGGQQGPSADRLLVDGRTVKYFADEVRTILDIVLASNPQQKSNELRPPPGSDALVVLLVKTALDDSKTRTMIRRIAEGQPGFTDAIDLKVILDKLHKEAKGQQPAQPVAQAQHPQTAANGTSNGHPPSPAAAAPAAQIQQPSQQALRSKGPPPAPPKPDIAAIALEFSGGTGDRYLFPKFSILEPLPGNQQVVASFLIVRKGSTSEYGGDPKLDYYQPVTIRLYTHTGRHLDNLAKIVAPPDEVRRYMEDVMDNMTRAEYVLLAMRLPRNDKGPEDEANGKEAAPANSSATAPEPILQKAPATNLDVNWGTPALREFRKEFPTKDVYDKFVAVRAKEIARGPQKARPMSNEHFAKRQALFHSGLELNPHDDMPGYDALIQSLTAKDRAADSS